MRELIWRARAVTDMGSIAEWTTAQHGAEKAAEYLHALYSDAKALREFPHRHPVHTSRKTEFRKARSGEHFLFYLVKDEAINVVRVLHKSMDFEPTWMSRVRRRIPALL